ncbi:hypothetical protein HY745_06045 [Candidatus Desantisbacteria bacterium]|nr:hypothetical protein [Candidatus Desantisbacteria bacterium]
MEILNLALKNNRAWLPVIIKNPHTMCIQLPEFKIDNVLIDFMPNLKIPLLGVKSFLSNFILTIDYPKKCFSIKTT